MAFTEEDFMRYNLGDPDEMVKRYHTLHTAAAEKAFNDFKMHFIDSNRAALQEDMLAMTKATGIDTTEKYVLGSSQAEAKKNIKKLLMKSLKIAHEKLAGRQMSDQEYEDNHFNQDVMTTWRSGLDGVINHLMTQVPAHQLPDQLLNRSSDLIYGHARRRLQETLSDHIQFGDNVKQYALNLAKSPAYRAEMRDDLIHEDYMSFLEDVGKEGHNYFLDKKHTHFKNIDYIANGGIDD